MEEYTTFSLETRAENVTITDGKHPNKVHVKLDGIAIGDIYDIVEALANSGDRNVTEFKKWFTRKVEYYPHIERLWMDFWSKSKFEEAKARLRKLSDMELIKEVNDHMADSIPLDFTFLTASRTELDRRRIDYSSINNWDSIRDWTKVSFYNIRGRKFIKPVNRKSDTLN